MTLGYREAELVADGPLGPAGARYRGHEFHFASLLGTQGAAPLFRCRDAAGTASGDPGARVGTVIGTVMGSFLHLVDRAPEAAVRDDKVRSTA